MVFDLHHRAQLHTFGGGCGTGTTKRVGLLPPRLGHPHRVRHNRYARGWQTAARRAKLASLDVRSGQGVALRLAQARRDGRTRVRHALRRPEHRAPFAPRNHPRPTAWSSRGGERIEDVLQSHHFRSGEELEATLHRSVWLYNQPLSQSALGSKTPLQAVKDWHKLEPELFKKRPYDLAGCDRLAVALRQAGRA